MVFPFVEKHEWNEWIDRYKAGRKVNRWIDEKMEGRWIDATDRWKDGNKMNWWPDRWIDLDR